VPEEDRSVLWRDRATPQIAALADEDQGAAERVGHDASSLYLL
jgi:hypothetical protein